VVDGRYRRAVADAFTDSRRFRILAIVDDFTRECLALVPDTSLSGVRVAVNSTPSSPGAVDRRLSWPTMGRS